MNNKVKILCSCQNVFLLLGILVATLGLSDSALAQGFVGNTGIGGESDQIVQVIKIILAYIEGPFGALIMIAAGLGAIASAAFGQYSAALSLFVVGVGSFILRNIVEAFFPVDLR